MARRNTFWRWMIVLAAAGGLLYYWRSGGGGPNGTERLTNQLWVERLPRDDRDLFHQIVILDKNDQRVGVVARSSRWQIHADVFLWGLDRDLLRTRFPQENKRLAFRVRTWRCAGQAPRPFDLCLEVSRGRRSARFYSRDEWVIRDGAAPEGTGAFSGSVEVARRARIEGGLDEGTDAPPDDWPLP